MQDLYDTLHQEHGHQPLGRIAEAIKLGGLIPHVRGGLPRLGPSHLQHMMDSGHTCSDCLKSNSHHRRHSRYKVALDIKPMEVIHCDIIAFPKCVPGRQKQLDGYFPANSNEKFILLCVDEATRYLWGKGMTDKSKESVAKACIELDHEMRALANSARMKSASFANDNDYTEQRIRELSRCFFRHMHSDKDSALLSQGTVPVLWEPNLMDGGPDSVYGLLRPPLTVQPLGPFSIDGCPTSSHGDPHRKWENGLAERKHQQIERRALSMMSAASVGNIAYADAYKYAIFLENLMPTSIPIPTTRNRRRGVPFLELLGFPYEVARRPLHVFGAVAHVPLTGSPTNPLPKHSIQRDSCLFLGRQPYPSRDLIVTQINSEGTVIRRLCTPETLVNSWDVIHRRLEHRRGVLASEMATPFIPIDHYVDEPEEEEEAPEVVIIPTSASLTLPTAPQSIEPVPWNREGRLRTGRGYLAPRGLSATLRTRETGSRYASAQRLLNLTTVLLARKVEDYLDEIYSDVTEKYCQALDKVRGMHALSIRPNLDGSLRRNLSDFPPEEVRQAIHKEYIGLYEAGVFEGCLRRPPNKVLLDTKMVLKVRNNNTIKARCTARGFLQRYGSDFFQTFAAVSRHETILFVICLAASFGLQLEVADAAMAFIQADMQEENYIDLPKDLKETHDAFRGYDCFKLIKTLYGTKQAAREWGNKLTTALKESGMTQSNEDPCLYFRLTPSGTPDLIICTVVDDLLAAGVDGAWRSFLPKLISKGIKLDEESIGPAVEFAGIKIDREGKHRYRLSQENYWVELEASYHELTGWRPPKNPKPIPIGPTLDKVMTSLEDVFIDSDPDTLTKAQKMDLEVKLDSAKQKKLTHKFQSLLGSIAWAAHTTRPDLAYVSSLAGEKLREPTARHLHALEGALAYALATKDKSLIFDCSAAPRRMNLIAFSDSDYAADAETRRSRSGIWLALNGAPLYWQSKRQTVLAGSSTAAETIASHTAMVKIRSTAATMRAMGFDTSYVPLMVDNAATLKRVINGRSVDGDGAKDLSVKVKMLQEAASVEHRDIWPFYVNTDDNISDIFTKGALSGQGANEKWAELESRARGRPDNLPHFNDLLKAKRPKPDHRGHSVPAIELSPPITSLYQFKRQAAWDKVYPHFFQAPTKVAAQALAAKGAALIIQAVLGKKVHRAEDLEQKFLSEASQAPLRGNIHHAEDLEREFLFDASTAAAEAFTKQFGLKTNDQGKFILTELFTVVEVFSGPNKSACTAISGIVANPEMLQLISVDIEPAYNPTVVADACTWDPFTILKPGQVVHFAWFSPPCTDYSRAKTTKARDLSAGDATAKATLRLLKLIRPICWTIENPKGYLRHRPFMRPFLRFLKETTYCKYDGFRYRKETDLFTNIQIEPLHCRRVPCEHKRLTGRHPEVAQQGPGQDGTPGNSLENLHRVPHKLIQDMFSFVFKMGARCPTDYLHVFDKFRPTMPSRIALPVQVSRYSRYSTQDWMLLPHIFEQEARSVMEMTGNFFDEPSKYWIELFRAPGNELCMCGFTEEMDSLDERYLWAGHSFYGNPPYTSDVITRTLNKALRHHRASPKKTEFLFILPKWTRASWYDLLGEFSILREWPKGTNLFTRPQTSHHYVNGRMTSTEGAPDGREHAGPTPWPVLLVYKGPAVDLVNPSP